MTTTTIHATLISLQERGLIEWDQLMAKWHLTELGAELGIRVAADPEGRLPLVWLAPDSESTEGAQILPGKLETRESPDSHAENIASTQDADPLASATAAFVEAQEHLSGASSMLVAATYDLAHHYAIAVDHQGVEGNLLRRLPDDLALRGMVAEARIDRKFLEEIIATLAEARAALNTVVQGGPVDDGWGISCWIGNAYYMPVSDVWRIPTFILYIQDYRDIIDFFDHQDACAKGNCGFYERQFGDFTVLFFTDFLTLGGIFPSAHAVGSVHSCNGGLSINFASDVVLNKELFERLFGTMPPPWLRTLSATLSLKLCLTEVPRGQLQKEVH